MLNRLSRLRGASKLHHDPRVLEVLYRTLLFRTWLQEHEMSEVIHGDLVVMLSTSAIFIAMQEVCGYILASDCFST